MLFNTLVFTCGDAVARSYTMDLLLEEFKGLAKQHNILTTIKIADAAQR